MRIETERQIRFLYFGVFLTFVAIYILHCLMVNYVADDGFIAFQYVRNLVRGEGLVYNPGERVEGYNNFLWIVLLAGFQWLLPETSLLRIAQTLGVVFGVLTILLVCRFSWSVCRESRALGLLAGALLAVHSGFAAWATAGLETTLFAFLVFASAYAYVSYLRIGKKFLLVPLLFAFASLTRPDAFLLFAITTCHLIVREWKLGQPLPIGRMFLWGSIFAAVYVPYYIWRFIYYGYPLPNTFYAKVGSGSHQYIRGARYLLDYLSEYGAFLFILVLLVLMRRDARKEWRDYFALIAAGYIAYLVYVGGDGLGFFRFFVYLVPILYLLVQDGFADLYRRASGLSFITTGRMLNLVTLCLIVISLGVTMRQSVFPLFMRSSYRWYEPQSQLSFPGLGTDHSYIWFDNYFVDRLAIAAKWLETHASQNAVVASTPAGSIAYHMDHKVIDMLGLNDLHIARTASAHLGKGRAGHEKGDGKYVLLRSPDYILMGNVAVLPYPLNKEGMAKKLVLKSERELWANPAFHDAYELVCIQLSDTGVFRYFTFFKRKGSVLIANPKDPENKDCGESL
jgi:arabinofuranosyltransferase